MKRLYFSLLLLFVGALCFSQEVKFAFLTDCHYSEGADRIGVLEECIADINRAEPVDFVLFGGDITDFGTDEEIAGVKKIFDKLEYKYYVVAGNHDAKWSESGCNTFLKVFGYEHFEFEAGGWRFLGSNSGPDMRMTPALLPRESMVWLSERKPGQKSIFVNHFPQDSSVLNYFEVTRELKRIGVQWEIGGHWHSNHAMNYDGIPAVLCRSTYNNGTGYALVKLTSNHVSVSDRKKTKDGWTTFSPWYEKDLGPIVDETVYDQDGFPDSYPWIRYDINKTYPAVKTVWSLTEEANIVSGFARGKGIIYYTTSSGTLKAVREKDGKQLWSVTLPGKVFSTVALAENRLVVGCTDGKIYCLNTSKGKTLWTVQAQKSVLGSPFIAGNTVYIGASDGKFRAIALKSGKVLWETEIEGFVETTPYVDSRQVVFGTWAQKLYSLDPVDGKVQWVWKTPKNSRMYSPAATVPVKSNGRIFIAVPDRKVYAIDAASGKTLFWVNGGRETIGLSADGKTVYAKTMNHRCYAFDAAVDLAKVGESGELPQSAQKWNVENTMGYEISPTPIEESGNLVLVPSDKGNLFALDKNDGHIVWIHKTSIALINPIKSWIKKDVHYILLSTMDGKVELLEYNPNSAQ